LNEDFVDEFPPVIPVEEIDLRLSISGVEACGTCDECI